MAAYGNGKIIYRGTITLGDEEIDLGEFDSEEDCQNAIDLEQAKWDKELQDAASPPKTIKCHNCEGTGVSKGTECNMCAGTGRIPE